jgi:hypothetical protein
MMPIAVNRKARCPIPSWAEIGQQYAAQVKAAVLEDTRQELIYVKKAYAHERVTPGSLPGTALVATLKKIARELDTRWQIDDEPLTEEQKERILRETGEALGLENPEEFVWLTKGASNDAYMQMVSYIGAVLQAARKK